MTPRLTALFQRITAAPRTIVVFGLLLMAAAAAFVPQLAKDTSADAFIAEDNPALLYRDRVREIFGLEDPFVVAVVNRGEHGIYNPATLALVQWLTDRVQRLDNVDPARVTSLATESDIRGTAVGMEVEEFFQRPPETVREAQAVQRAIAGFPLFQGSLVARDGQATLVVAEVLDEKRNQATYDALMELAREAPRGPGDEIHVAGEGAISGYLGSYIDRDAQRLNPLAGVVITLVLLVAFRTLRGALLPNLIVAATLAGAVGSMAAFGVSFFVITNGLVAILIGIAVADSIHIFSRYYELARERPEADARQLVVQSMADMARPVTFTTLTTIAGFAGLSLASDMPPMQYFGLFAGVGVLVAWLYSMTFLPAALVLLKPRPSPAMSAGTAAGGRFGGWMEGLGRQVLRRPAAVVAGAALVAALGAAGASRVSVEEQRIENFQSDEPIYRADAAINRHLDGIYHFDVVLETPEPEGLFQPERLRRIEALQHYAESLPHVNGSTSVVDYIKQMHRAVNEGRQDAYRIPDDPRLIAQLFLLYSASGNPTDFEEEIDYDYRQALVRLQVDTGSYRNNRRLVDALQAYLDRNFADGEMNATLTGRLKVDYHWIDNIASNHLSSLALSLAMVGLMAAALLRSVLGGVMALLPVGAAVLLVYAVMGFGGIWLGVGTSMFAAIAIGLGVDFAIHTLDRLRELMWGAGEDLDARIQPLFPGTGRALLFNFLALSLGFLVLTTSEVPPLVNFGALVAVAVSAAFLCSITLLPALARLLRPAFLTGQRGAAPGRAGAAAGTTAAAVLSLGVLAGAGPAGAQSPLPEGRAVMEQLNQREEGISVARELRMEMTDRRGTTRVRETRGFRKYFGDEKRTVIFYEAPANVKGTAFLTYDYPDAGRDDDQWLYLPGLRKVRRISASDRGDYFLGTDFTYEDIKKESKVALADYRFQSVGQERVDGVQTLVVEGRPVDAATAEELGYGQVRWFVDREIWFPRRTQIWDVNGNPLKTIHIQRFEQIDGIWTAMRLHVQHHMTGHQTVFQFSNVDYQRPVPDRVFTKRSLRRGFY